MVKRDWPGLASAVLEEGVKALVPGSGPLVALASKAMEPATEGVRRWWQAKGEQREVADLITRWARSRGIADADIADGMIAAIDILRQKGASMLLVAELNLNPQKVAAHVLKRDGHPQEGLSAEARSVCAYAVELFYRKLVMENRPDLDRAVQQVILLRQEHAQTSLERLPELLSALDHAPERLREHIKPVTTIRHRRTEFFVGREFVMNALDERLGELSSGYVMITGEPGIGKSAVMAELVRTRGYVHHFNVATSGIRTADQLLRNVCAQLILRYKLNYSELPADAGTDSDFLDRLLRQAVEQARTRNALPLVVAVDALDEAESPSDEELRAGVNRLKLPADLPNGVVVVASIRQNVPDLLTVTHRSEPIPLRADDPQNLVDVRTYVSTFLEHRPQMADRLAEWQKSRAQFVSLLADRSEGNFMYLVHVLNGIERGDIVPKPFGGADGLPSGLKDYYSLHWRSMRDSDVDRFERMQRPVVCMLAASPGPVTAAQVARWISESGGFEPLSQREVDRVLREWRQFLDEVPGNPPRWRIYHTSFLSFLATEADDVDLAQYREAVIAATAQRIDWDS